jgi:hypothetical protein
VQARAHATQPRLNVAIARVQIVELRIGSVGLPLRGDNRHDDQRQQAQQRDGDNRPGLQTPAAGALLGGKTGAHRMLFLHSLILSVDPIR